MDYADSISYVMCLNLYRWWKNYACEGYILTIFDWMDGWVKYGLTYLPCS